MATRIKARAARRAGELLKQIEAGQGARDGKREVADRPPLRGEIARDAGMSPHQSKQAQRIASVPEADFDAQVESPKPPTLTALAQSAPCLRRLGKPNAWPLPPSLGRQELSPRPLKHVHQRPDGRLSGRRDGASLCALDADCRDAGRLGERALRHSEERAGGSELRRRRKFLIQRYHRAIDLFGS